MFPVAKPSQISPSSDWFTTTHWSVVLMAGQNHSPAATEALERLCRTYWYPLYAYVRRQGYSPEDAKDLTQGFFERVVEKSYFQDLDRSKGRFRAFLLAALKHFLSDCRDRACAAKRGGGTFHVPWDTNAEERYVLNHPDTISPDALFQRQWAITVLERAMARLREEFVSAGKAEIFDKLRGVMAGQKGDETYAELGISLGRSEAAMKSTVRRIRTQYREFIREEIAHTVSSPREIAEEIRFLLSVFSS
jgi:DNA-directed RNA polymerase specialized sigma24 family protein